MRKHASAIGTDIIEIHRIQQAVDHWHDAFLKRIYSAAELNYCSGRLDSLAARFAAKEAVVKTLGAMAKGLSWLEIEVLPGENDEPYVKLSGNALKRAGELGLTEVSISMSHCKEYAVAFSVGHAN